MNKYEEALDFLKVYVFVMSELLKSEDHKKLAEQSYSIIKELVDKETPKKVSKYKLWHICSNCNDEKKYIGTAKVENYESVYHYDTDEYCWRCGQKLDWDEEDK